MTPEGDPVEPKREIYRPAQIDTRRIGEFLGEGWSSKQVIAGWLFEYRRDSKEITPDLKMTFQYHGRFELDGSLWHPAIPIIEINSVEEVWLQEKGKFDSSSTLCIAAQNGVNFLFYPEDLSGEFNVGEEASVRIEYRSILGAQSGDN